MLIKKTPIFRFWLNWWCLTSFLSSLALAYLQYGLGFELTYGLVAVELWSASMGVLQALLLKKYHISRAWILVSIAAPFLCVPIFLFLAALALLSCCYYPKPILYTITLSVVAFISGCVFASIQAFLPLRRFSRKKEWIVVNGLGFALLAQIGTLHENAISIFGLLSNVAWLFSAVGFGFIQSTSMAWLLRSEINNH
jgi:hypothetical protein